MITPEGDYLSNLSAPDLRPYFKHLHWRVMPHSMGHLVASDWADKAVNDPVFGLYKNCGLWTRDEAAILYICADCMRGPWVDIGAHTGWTTAHIQEGSRDFAYPVDPIHALDEFKRRINENLHWGDGGYVGADITSNQYFKQKRDAGAFACGFVIDGDHSEGKPLEDAKNAYKHLAETGVILFHDGIGRPVREAVTWLMDQGMKARCYFTPHIVFACWRGDFKPPDHKTDPRIDWRPHLQQMKRDFEFSRLS